MLVSKVLPSLRLNSSHSNPSIYCSCLLESPISTFGIRALSLERLNRTQVFIESFWLLILQFLIIVLRIIELFVNARRLLIEKRFVVVS